MMSKNSSSGNSNGLQRQLLKRRIAVELILVLIFVIGFIIYPLLDLIETRSWLFNPENIYSSSYQQMMFLSVAENVFGYSGIAEAISIFAAALLGLEGFAWLHSRQQVDFYMSQPVKESRRFFGICINNILIFVFLYAIIAAIGIGISIALGVSTSIIRTAIAEFLRCFALFSAVSAVAIISDMLTGKMIIAGLAFLTLSFYEMISRDLLDSLADAYFKTYNPASSSISVTSPISWYSAFDDWRGILINIAFAVIVIFIAWLVYRKRKKEEAGKAVIHKSVRAIVKILISVLAGMLAAVSVTYIGNNIITVICAVIAAVIMSFIMEAIYNYDVRQCFKGILWDAAAMVIVVAIVLMFECDLTGYDSWIPSVDKVEDAYIANEGIGSDGIYDITGNWCSNEQFAEINMHLTDIESLNKVLDIGENYTKTSDNYGPEYLFVIGYRMKNGTVKSRSVYLPCDTDPQLLSTLLNSDEYEKNTNEIYNDEFFEANTDYLTIGYNFFSNGDNVVYDGSLYEEIKAAYLVDMEQFNYEFARNNAPVGFIDVTYSNDDDMLNGSAEMTLPVYGQFKNTIDFLKQYGIYSDMINNYETRVYGPFNEYIEWNDGNIYNESENAVG